MKHLKDAPLQRQWVQLKSQRLVAGHAGELELEVTWRHAEGFQQLHPVKQSALQQLQARPHPLGPTVPHTATRRHTPP